MTVSIERMTRKYLVTHGYQGLFNADAGCGCNFKDLFACQQPSEGCAAAYLYECSKCKHGPSHDGDCEINTDESSYMMCTGKDLCRPEYVEE
jgi:hypothetical protein